MATYSALPATLNLVATVSNDFTLSLTVTESGSPWDATGATLATDIIDSSGAVVATDFTTAASTGTVSLSLTDTQTSTLGVGVYSYRLSVTKSSLTRDWIAGTLSVVEAGVGGSSTSSASLSISNSAVTLSLTSLVAPLAANISVADTAGNFTGDDVEEVLAEIDDRIDAHLADTVDAHDASAISVADAGGYYTGTTVEAVLAEQESKFVHTAGATPLAVSASTLTGALAVESGGLVRLTLDQDVAVTFPTATGAMRFTLVAVQDATGNRRVTWPAMVWANGLSPYVTGAADAVDAFEFIYDGTTWLGYVLGQNLDDAATMYDTFNRANSTTTLGSTDTGQAWTAHTGTWGISSNQAYLQTQSGDSVATFDFGNTEVDMRCRMTISSTGQPGLVFRATNDQNYLLVIMSSTAVSLWQRVTGTYTQLRSGAVTATPGVPYPVRIVAVGSDIRVYFNGKHALAFSTTQFASTGTRVGIRANDANANRWDDLEVVIPA